MNGSLTDTVALLLGNVGQREKNKREEWLIRGAWSWVVNDVEWWTFFDHPLNQKYSKSQLSFIGVKKTSIRGLWCDIPLTSSSVLRRLLWHSACCCFSCFVEQFNWEGFYIKTVCHGFDSKMKWKHQREQIVYMHTHACTFKTTHAA